MILTVNVAPLTKPSSNIEDLRPSDIPISIVSCKLMQSSSHRVLAERNVLKGPKGGCSRFLSPQRCCTQCWWVSSIHHLPYPGCLAARLQNTARIYVCRCSMHVGPLAECMSTTVCVFACIYVYMYVCVYVHHIDTSHTAPSAPSTPGRRQFWSQREMMGFAYYIVCTKSLHR